MEEEKPQYENEFLEPHMMNRYDRDGLTYFKEVQMTPWRLLKCLFRFHEWEEDQGNHLAFTQRCKHCGIIRK